MQRLGFVLLLVLGGCADELGSDDMSATDLQQSGGGDMAEGYLAHNVRALTCGGMTCALDRVCCLSGGGAVLSKCGSPYGAYCGESGEPWQDCYTTEDCPAAWSCCNVTVGAISAKRCRSACD